jgi:hypothetical protein
MDRAAESVWMFVLDPGNAIVQRLATSVPMT